MIVVADHLKLNKDSIAQLLIAKIEDLKLDVTVYYNFPFYRGESKDDLVQAHVLLISKKYGVIFFRCVDDLKSFNDEEKARLDNLDGHIFSKINKYEQFRLKRRELKINICPVVFASSYTGKAQDGVIGLNDLKDTIIGNAKEELSEDEFELLTAVIEGTVTLKQRKDRLLSESKTLTKGAILSTIQAKEAVFDLEQKKAALNIIDSPQRIRGLAGSGKTIILAMKAALFHLQNPDADILYTYFTKALYGQVKYLIEKYYRDFSDNREPDWNRINILHGWGGSGLRGVYSETCFDNNIPRISFVEAKQHNSKAPFSYIFEELDKHQLREKYDLTLIDEGQDFPKHFYRVCYKITKEKRIVWAYDDFQNIFDIDIQDEKETFGKDSKGLFFVDFTKDANKLQDIILYRCYRNPRYALISAFALGLGIYNDRVLQRLENNRHWEDLGFEVEKGNSNDHTEMIISRPEKNSPSETNKHFDKNSLIVKVCKDLSEECNFVVNSIIADIREGNLRPDDICVIGLDSKNIGVYFRQIQSGLRSKEIDVFNLLEAPSNNTFFSVENHVTLSTINKAKGNETGMVYIIGIDSTFSHKDFIIERNQLFTAITRSKGWVTMTGFQAAEQCVKEVDLLRANDYKLKFVQPSVKDTKTILRGMNQQQTFLNDVNKQIEAFAKNSGLSQEDILKMLASQTKDKK